MRFGTQQSMINLKNKQTGKQGLNKYQTNFLTRRDSTFIKPAYKYEALKAASSWNLAMMQ